MVRAYKMQNLRLLRVHKRINSQCSCGKRGCPYVGKHPAPWDGESKNRGVYNATDTYTPEDFEGYNVGIATGKRLLVVDIDPRNYGHHSWQELANDNEVPSTWVCETGGGGLHYYFRIPEGRNIRSMSYRGIDFQYDNKYVVAPPSVHPSGREYVWQDTDVECDEIAEAPEWLLTWLESHHLKQTQTMAPQGVTNYVEPHPYEWPWIHKILEELSPDIGYDNWLGVGMGLHATGASNAFDLWQEWSAKDPKTYRAGECEKKWGSFSAVRGVGESHTYRWIFAMADLYGIEYGETSEFLNQWFENQRNGKEERRERLDFEIAARRSKGSLNSLYEYAIQNSHVQIPAFGLAAALQIFSGVVQGSYVDPLGGSLNLYQWCAAPAGAGKDSYWKFVNSVLRKVRANLVSPEFGSVGGLRVALTAFNSRVSCRDEFHDEYLQITTGKNEYAKALLRDYKQLWNVPEELPLTVIKASATPRVCYPAFGLMGWSTVDGLKSCASKEFLTSGLGSRFLFWPMERLGTRQIPNPPELDKKLIERLRKLFEDGITMQGKSIKSDEEEIQNLQQQKQGGGLPQMQPKHRLELEDEDYFRQMTNQAWAETEQSYEKNLAHYASLYSRRTQQSLRLASLRALSDERMVVTNEDLDWGNEIVQANIERAIEMFVENEAITASDEDAMRRCEKVLDIVAMSNNPVTTRDISRKTRIRISNIEESLIFLTSASKILAHDKLGKRVYPCKIERGLTFRCPETE